MVELDWRIGWWVKKTNQTNTDHTGVNITAHNHHQSHTHEHTCMNTRTNHANVYTHNNSPSINSFIHVAQSTNTHAHGNELIRTHTHTRAQTHMHGQIHVRMVWIHSFTRWQHILRTCSAIDIHLSGLSTTKPFNSNVVTDVFVCIQHMSIWELNHRRST